LHQALLAARYAGGPLALSARDCLRMATMGGARCLGRGAELGSLEPGKLADLAIWRVDELPGAGIDDPVATLVFGAPALEHLFVGGRQVVTGGELRTADASELAAPSTWLPPRRVHHPRRDHGSRARDAGQCLVAVPPPAPPGADPTCHGRPH